MDYVPMNLNVNVTVPYPTPYISEIIDAIRLGYATRFIVRLRVYLYVHCASWLTLVLSAAVCDCADVHGDVGHELGKY